MILLSDLTVVLHYYLFSSFFVSFAVLDSMEKYALCTSFVTLYVGMFFFIVGKDGGDPSVLVIVGSCFIVGINVLYLVYAVGEILMFYASTQPGIPKKIMKIIIPITNRLFCRSMKQRKKKHQLLHQQTLQGKNKGKKGNPTKVTPSLKDDSDKRSNSAGKDQALRSWDEEQ
tara:strand:- start:26 stop:541 length:516 start_codon:yes stop_codon:yes gene_type:complete